MILIVSSSPREQAILTSMGDHRGWPCQVCTCVADLTFAMEKTAPKVLLIRHELSDGYSDDVLARLRQQNPASAAKCIVLMRADCSAQAEARQVAIGADCVLRDPLRMHVLLAYLDKFRTIRSASAPEGAATSFTVAGAMVYPHEHRMAVGSRSIRIAPQETLLLRLLARSPGKVVSYAVLYAELFNRRFVGDTANCRVLLGKVAASFKRLRIDFRAHLEVIPKSGYRCLPPGPPAESSSIRKGGKRTS